jgi:hypothetical protein
MADRLTGYEPLDDLEPFDGFEHFERRLAARLTAHAAIPVAPVDADAIAHGIVRTGRTTPLRVRWARLPAVAWVLLALATAAAATVLAAALLQSRDPGLPMALATETGLYLAEDDGSGARLLRADGSWIAPRWSPSGDLIAVLHGPPIPPQTGADGGPPRTPARFQLEATEVVVLDAAGVERFRVPGAAIGFAWSPPSEDGTSLLAVRRADGSVAVADADGRLLEHAIPADDAWTDVDAPLLQPGLAWAGPDVLLAVRRGEVLRAALGARAAAGVSTVARTSTGRINAIAVGPDGRTLAFVRAACRSGCAATARFVRLGAGAPSSTSALPDGRPAVDGIDAATAVSWRDDGQRILAWPFLAPSGDAIVLRAPTAPVLENRDVVPGLARLAPDGSGRVILMNQYPFFDDRHFDAWLVDPDGTATRVAQRSLGFDIRAAPGGSPTR